MGIIQKTNKKPNIPFLNNQYFMESIQPVFVSWAVHLRGPRLVVQKPVAWQVGRKRVVLHLSENEGIRHLKRDYLSIE